VEKNKLDAARKALSQVRGKAPDHPDVDRELEDIIQDFQGHEKMPLLAQVKATCSSGKVFYTFAMAVSLMFWQQWTGE
jgi:predicted component of type VI protein secretion system